MREHFEYYKSTLFSEASESLTGTVLTSEMSYKTGFTTLDVVEVTFRRQRDNRRNSKHIKIGKNLYSLSIPTFSFVAVSQN